MTVFSAVTRESARDGAGRGTKDGSWAPLTPPAPSVPKSSFASPACVVSDAITDATVTCVVVRLSLLSLCSSSAWDPRIIEVVDDVRAAGLTPGVPRAAF